MKSSKNDNKIIIMYRLSIIFFITSIILCFLIFRDINRSKVNYLKSQEILTINDDLDFLLQEIVLQSFQGKYQFEKKLMSDLANSISNKITKLELLVENQAPNENVVSEIGSIWNSMLSASDMDIFNHLYDLEKFQNSLFINEAITMNSNLLATSKNINLLSLLSIVSIVFSFVFFLVYNHFVNLKIKINQLELLKAKENSQTMISFLSIAGHELRTPLNGIIGLSEILRKSHLPETETYYADHLYHSGKTLLKITNNILELSRNILSPVELEIQDFPLLLIIQQVLTIYSFETQQKKTSLVFLIENEVPLRVTGDSSRISQVLFNLVGNAVFNTISGNIFLKIKTLSKKNDGSIVLQFSIEDTGIGLTDEDLKKMMNPAMEVQFTANAGGDLHILSYAVCNQLVQAMGGELKVKSQKGVGSTFSFTANFSKYSKEVLDTKQTNNDIQFNKISNFSPCFNINFRPIVLVVDDNPANLLIAQIMLERLGAKVITAANGKDALNIFFKSNFDLILMDCRMPEMDGFETTKHLRRSDVKIPIIAMTASVSSDDIARFSKSGMSGHIIKPLEIDNLTLELKKALCLNPNSFSLDALAKLEKSIGYFGMSQTVEAFLSDLPSSEEKLDNSIKNNDLEQIHRVGHRYKSSCLAVGAKGLASLFSNLETAADLTKAKELTIEIHNALPELKHKLIEHISHPS